MSGVSTQQGTGLYINGEWLSTNETMKVLTNLPKK